MPEQTKKTYLADIWGDTVDLRHLGYAMLIGIFLGTLFYLVGLTCIQRLRPDMVVSLQKAMGLVVGIVGCLCAAAVSTKLFPPKRKLTEEQFSPENRERVLTELNVDLAREAEEFESMPPEVIAEMKELQIYDVFTKKEFSSPTKKPL